mmetsp:Transcript_2836/g.8353  ORF Transcript_2836/g.8353 Transcript_2836/m.8353 type:complete len:524 (+) Transcript_2836:1674-3245(+)
MAATHEDKAQGQAREARHVQGGVRVRYYRQEELEDVVALGAHVGEPQAEDGGDLHHRVGGVEVLRQQGERRVALVTHASVENADCHERAGLDVVVSRVEELVDLREAAVHVPEEERAQGGGGGDHAVLLVLVQPLVALCEHELVRAESRVDEGVDEGGREVLARRIKVGRGALALEVGLVDVVWQLRFHDVELAREIEVVLRQVRARGDVAETLVLELGAHLLAREQEGGLLAYHLVLARVDDLHREVRVPRDERDPHGLRGLAHLAQDGDRRVQHGAVVGLRHVAGHLLEVEADAHAVSLVHVVDDLREEIHLHEEVDGLRFRVVLHEEGHHLADEVHNVCNRALVRVGDALVPRGHLLVLRGNLAAEVAHVLVSPGPDVVDVAMELELERLPLPLGAHGHREHRQDVGEKLLVRRIARALKGGLEGPKVRPQKFQGLGHRGHGGCRGPDLVHHGIESRLLDARVLVQSALSHHVQIALELQVLRGEVVGVILLLLLTTLGRLGLLRVGLLLSFLLGHGALT